ncbi:laccase domain protein Cgl2154/cg2365 [Actinomycetes bacterium]|nr:laccase domain protein Cgl2154/cg2365 [Actinomycetota bacterium]GDX20812.1 laccase domain protein Cgl2154/cg2365 [Actinomycetes bacterium]
MAQHVGDDPESVATNRQLLAKITGPVQFMNQVHGDEVVEIKTLGDDPTCDALITTLPGIALAVMVADCIPLLLSSSTVVGAVHVGRRGLMNSVAIKALDAMRKLGAGQIHAQLGASICGRCYEVPQDLADEVTAKHPAATSLTNNLTPALDLPRALIADLVAHGVTYEATSRCTLEDNEYFSYRRHNITGRNAGVVWL